MISQRQAERMQEALELIAEDMQAFIESEDPDYLPAPGTLLRLARRALDPDEWERVHD